MFRNKALLQREAQEANRGAWADGQLVDQVRARAAATPRAWLDQTPQEPRELRQGLTKPPRSLGNCARALPARLLKELLLRAGLRPASGRGPGRASQACAAPRERLRSTMILSSGELRSGTAGALLCPLTAADSLGLLRRLIEWLPCRPAGAAFPAPTAACGTAGHLETARGLAIPLRYTFPVQPGREAALHGVGGP
eukprot:CAMPEP_0168452474 /NCGR_PEP_ID=MMETSP0228-20121227/49178_1 /TAXON_ID=133427 /ORGANISM="Protoceratium reticulatum, Strain CCCM 535 (=CCMP 1889)" /LENGTH=196 /DNA_ID=CAMNT_0008467139 /DNA_START=301 /DNA_END=891 /DNA_ORIENTATION=-